jgi:hypothetical protein
LGGLDLELAVEVRDVVVVVLAALAVEVVDVELVLCLCCLWLGLSTDLGAAVVGDVGQAESEYSDSEALRRISRNESWADEEEDEGVDRKVGKRIMLGWSVSCGWRIGWYIPRYVRGTSDQTER